MPNWNPYSRAAYTLETPEGKIGFGHLKVFDAVPGAWNILCLCTPMMQDIMPWEGAAEDFPTPVLGIALSVGLALQLDPKRGVYIGHLAESLNTPLEFVDAIRGIAGLIPVLYCGEDWWGFVQARAEKFAEYQQKATAKILDFKTGKTIQ